MRIVPIQIRNVIINCINMYFPLILFCILFIIPGALYSQNFNPKDHLIGESLINYPINNESLAEAKQRAMADLANQIQARVKSEVISSISESDYQISRDFSSNIKVISELQVRGVQWYTFKDEKWVSVKAILNKQNASQLYLEESKILGKKLYSLMERISQLVKENDNESALILLNKASTQASNFEQNFTIFLILGGDKRKFPKQRISQQDIETKIFALSKRNFDNFDEVISGLSYQLSKQTPKGSNVSVFPFYYQDTSFGSEFSGFVRQKLDNGLQAVNLRGNRDFEESKISKEKISIYGSYWIVGKDIDLIVSVYDSNGHIVGTARIKFPMNFIEDLNIALKPQNFVDAYSEDKYFKKNELVYGDLKIDFWTNKGHKNLIFKEGDEMRLYVRANNACHLRFIYHLANGYRTMLYDNYYINSNKINKVVELPDIFICSPPFGVEKLQILVSTNEFPPLAHNEIIIDGNPYEIISDDLPQLLSKTRGFIKKKNAKTKVAERVITITTVK